MQTKGSKIKTLEEFKEAHYGKRGTAKRDKLEKGFEPFKLGALPQAARKQERGFTEWESPIIYRQLNRIFPFAD